MDPEIKFRILVGAIIFLFLFVVISTLTPKLKLSEEEETAKCIGENSVLYVKVGCDYCQDQKDLFKNYIPRLNIIDCFHEPEKCIGVSVTPSWKIHRELFTGVKSIEELKGLTGC